MEFDKSKVYTSLNADELKPGSRVIVADCLNTLKQYVEQNDGIVTLVKVNDEAHLSRFFDGESSWCLAYLISPPEEFKLRWSDLKVGDIIRLKFYDGYRTAMVTVIDTCTDTTKHVGLTTTWLDDTEIADWEKVEE